MLTELLKDRNRLGRLCYIVEAALGYFISIMVSGAYLARITSTLGFSDSLTGILSSFLSLGCVFQLGTIALFRRVKRVKRPIVLCNLVTQTLFALVYLTPLLPMTSGQKSAVFLVCYCGAHILSNATASPKIQWLMGLVPDRSRGIFTARKEIVSLLGGMIFTYISGMVIDLLEAAGNQRMTFVVGTAVMFVLTVMHTASMLPVPEQPAQEQEAASGSLRELLRNRHFLRIVLVIIVWNVASCCATPFYGAYQIKELGFSMTFVSILSVIYSLVRVAASTRMGRFADRTSFSQMVSVCFGVSAVGFLAVCFAVPGNGQVIFTVYNCLNAVAMAGINSALMNLVYDCVQGDNRRSALAISSALGGVFGFVSTCLMSPLVSLIQQQNNMLFGLRIYPAQLTSGIASVLILLLVIYMRCVVIPAEKRARQAQA